MKTLQKALILVDCKDMRTGLWKRDVCIIRDDPSPFYVSSYVGSMTIYSELSVFVQVARLQGLDQVIRTRLHDL